MIEPEQGAIIPYVATMSLTTAPKPTPDGALRLKRKSPGDWPRLDFDMRCYIFGLQVLDEASHTPPALSQSSFVLAMVTSPAKADVANATPRASARV